MREAGLDEKLIRACASHGWGITVDLKPEHIMEKVLYATDELTGLIGAVAIMRPSKSSERPRTQIGQEEIQGQKVCGGLFPRRD